MDENHKIAAIVAPICWLLGSIGGLILFFTLNKDIRSAWTFSYVLGLLVGLLTMGISVKGATKVSKMAEDEDEAGSPIKINMLYFLFRILLLAAIFTMVIVNQFVTNVENPDFNVWATLIGYILTKIVLLAVMLILKGKVKDNE